MTNKNRRRLGGSERGQASFEFLLIIPIFLSFALLTIDFGMMMYQYLTVANGAREGARYAAVSCFGGTCTATEITNKVQEGSAAFVSDGEVTVLRNAGSSTPMAPGDSVIVKITHQYDFLFVPGVHINIVGCAAMVLESATNAPTGLATGTHCDGT